GKGIRARKPETVSSGSISRSSATACRARSGWPKGQRLGVSLPQRGDREGDPRQEARDRQFGLDLQELGDRLPGALRLA
ncbi:hypothetical protein CTI14_68510, partial [Methylobacterium radiotolerans]